MSKHQKPSPGWTRPAVLLALLVLSAPEVVQAQQAEVPPASDNPVVEDGSQDERIVAHRPRFYSIKRAAHPVAWFEGAMSPVLKLAERFGGSVAEAKTPAVSGVKFGVKGLGGSTGFGPSIKPFHNNLFNTGIRFEMPLVVTYKMYESAGFRLAFPLISGEANGLDVDVAGDYVSRPSDFFYGLGNDTADSNESRFRTVSRTASAGINLRVFKSWSTRLESGFRSVGVTDPREPTSMAEVFHGQNIPGLMTGATMNVTTAALQRNTRDHPHIPASGGLQRFEASLIEGQKGGDFSYWRYRMELQQFLPLSEDHSKVIGLRADVETNRPKGGSMVPFFDMPTVGGSSTVRGFWTGRFTDRSAMTVSAEYRYRIWRYFDWGMFVDGGQVAPEIDDFGMDRFHVGYGMRFIVRSEKRRGIIVDLAHSREAWVVYLDFRSLF